MKANWMHKISMISLSIMLFVFAGSAAVHANTGEQTVSKQTIKVMYKEKYLFDETLFKKQYPNAEIKEVYWDGKTRLTDFIAKQTPDIVMLNTLEYKQLVKGSQLVDLGQLIQRDQYDTTSIYPGLLEALKNNGKLYGLSPTFNTQAIYYNVDLFKKYGVALPHDGMTWEEILKLAAKFPTKGSKDTRVWGLDYPLDKYVYLLNNIADSEGLTRYDPDNLKAAMNTAPWKKTFAMAVSAIKSGTIEGTNTSGYSNNSFIMGRSAMLVAASGTDTLRDITADKSALPNFKPFKVGIAAGPADPKNKKTTRNILLPAIMTIPTGSTNKELAWDFIKFYNGVEFAKSQSGKLGDYALSRMDDSKEYKGYRLDAFYKLKPNLDSPAYQNPLGMSFDIQYSNIVQGEIKQVINNKKNQEKALQSINTQVQNILNKAGNK